MKHYRIRLLLLLVGVSFYAQDTEKAASFDYIAELSRRVQIPVSSRKAHYKKSPLNPIKPMDLKINKK